MIIKELVYNHFILKLFEDGTIRLKDKKCIIPQLNIADVPIINELMKDLVEEFVNWKRKQ